jgi:hypothetical protein
MGKAILLRYGPEYEPLKTFPGGLPIGNAGIGIAAIDIKNPNKQSEVAIFTLGLFYIEYLHFHMPKSAYL